MTAPIETGWALTEAGQTLAEVIELADSQGYQLIRWEGTNRFYLAGKATGEIMWGNRSTTLADLALFLALPSA